MIKILVTGAGGLLGRKLASANREDVRIFATGRASPQASQPHVEPLDVTDGRQVETLIDRIRPDWVIHAAALTDVDRCEVERELARQVNVEGTQNVVRACEKRRIGLVGLSTDYVFDGAAGPYAEPDLTNPLSYYGFTKCEAEKSILSMTPPGGVVRTIVLFGYAPSARANFVTWLVRSLRQGKPVKVVTDQWGTPTLADDLADFLVDFCRKTLSGLFHFAGGELLSRYDMAIKVCRVFGLDEHLVTPVSTGELGQLAPRPLRSGLKTDRVRQLLQIHPRSFEESLRILFAQTDGLKTLF